METFLVNPNEENQFNFSSYKFISSNNNSTDLYILINRLQLTAHMVVVVCISISSKSLLLKLCEWLGSNQGREWDIFIVLYANFKNIKDTNF